MEPSGLVLICLIIHNMDFTVLFSEVLMLHPGLLIVLYILDLHTYLIKSYVTITTDHVKTIGIY